MVSDGAAAAVASRVVTCAPVSAAVVVSRAAELSPAARLLSLTAPLSAAELLSRAALLFFAPGPVITLPRESVDSALLDSPSRVSLLSRVLFVPPSDSLRLRLVSSSVVLRFFEEEVSFSSLY